MVQYSYHNSRLSTISRKEFCDGYCELGAELKRRPMDSVSDLKVALERRKFYFKRAEKKDRLWALYHRLQRGLPSYDQWTVPELKALFRTRGLTIYAEKFRKTDLIEALEQTDEEVRFEKFMDLPPEMRIRVYSVYYNAF